MNKHRIFLGTGWKMNKSVRDAIEYTRRLLELLAIIPNLDCGQIFLVPPFTAIEAVKKNSQGKLWVGAQNMHWEEWGSFTGEISAPMLQELGVDLVELGHAERRHYFNETDVAINKKVLLALQYGMRPLICVGEGLEDKEYGVQKETVARQLRIGLHGVPRESAKQLIVAYEPVWAIGEEGTPADPDFVRVMHTHIRSLLADIFGPETSIGIPVLYGGTVNSDNAASLLTEGQTDGLFIGRAAWDANKFADLIDSCVKAVAVDHRPEG
jgi:triosephosphate isomerase